MRSVSPFNIPGYSLLLKLLGKVGVWHVLGSRVTIGLSAAFAPAIGFFSSPATCISVYIIRTGLSLLTSPMSLIGTYYLPTLAGSLVLSSQSRSLQIIMPLICIVTFALHPVGSQCMTYTLYWFIPIVATLLPSSVFLRSLSSTFVTHAVGSTIFLYTHPTTSTYWHTLIPQVWLERLIYTLLLSASYYIIKNIIAVLNHLRRESSLCQSRSLSC